MVGHLAAAKNFGRLLEVFEAGVYAGQQVGLVHADFLFGQLGHRDHGLDGVGSADAGDHFAEVHPQNLGVTPIRVGGGGAGFQGRNGLLGEGRVFADAAPEPGESDPVAGKDSGQGAPLGGHVGDGETGLHGERRHPGAGEFHRVVENLVVGVEPAKGHDQVLARNPGPQFPAKLHPGHRRHLPPGFAGGPQSRRVGADHGGAQRSDAAVHVRVGIRSHDQGAGPGVTLLDHHLVADSPPGRVKVDSVEACEGLDGGVLGLVFLGEVLDVVVESEDRLPWVVDAGRAEGGELRHHSRRIVVGHDVPWPHRHIVAGGHRPTGIFSGEVALNDFLDEILSHGGGHPTSAQGPGEPGVGRSRMPG